MSHSEIAVLIVDDERQMCDFLEIGLARIGCRTGSTADGPAALSELRHKIPGVVVLDLMVPKIDGIALSPPIRCIALRTFRS